MARSIKTILRLISLAMRIACCRLSVMLYQFTKDPVLAGYCECELVAPRGHEDDRVAVTGCECERGTGKRATGTARPDRHRYWNNLVRSYSGAGVGWQCILVTG